MLKFCFDWLRVDLIFYGYFVFFMEFVKEFFFMDFYFDGFIVFYYDGFFMDFLLMESCSTHKGCVFLLIGFELIFFVLFDWFFFMDFFVSDFFLWIFFLNINFFYPLKLILNFLAAILNFLAAILNFFCGFLVYSQSCGNKVVFVFWYTFFWPPKTHFKNFWWPFWIFRRPF